MKEKGFTLFIAIVITATLLLVSTGIISVAVKEAFLTTANRHSQEAFYAADSGLECALFWDLKNPSQSAFSLTQTSSITCNQQVFPSVGGPSGQSKFTITFPPGPNCVEVYVIKRAVQIPKTTIEAYGYNTCNLNDPRRVQRAIRVKY
ncbi:MAG: pilus assembly PilX N-terminal domain-containing protein [Patescibacteria group bacterium]